MYHCFRLQPTTKITTAQGLETAIDLLEFALFLAAQVRGASGALQIPPPPRPIFFTHTLTGTALSWQMSHREASGAKAAVQRQEGWPSAPESVPGGDVGLSPRSRERRRSAAEERNGRLTFVRNHLAELLRLLSFQGTFADKLKPHQLDRLRILVAGWSNLDADYAV